MLCGAITGGIFKSTLGKKFLNLLVTKALFHFSLGLVLEAV